MPHVRARSLERARVRSVACVRRVGGALLGASMTRAKALALAAQAVNAASTEPEANTAARILARLIHENPDLLLPDPEEAPPMPGDFLNNPPRPVDIDPFIGFAVREAFSVAGDLFRDFMRGPTPARARAAKNAAPTWPDAGAQPKCLAVLDGRGQDRSFFCHEPKGHAGDHRSALGHVWQSAPSANGAPKPGPRKATSPRRVRPRGRP